MTKFVFIKKEDKKGIFKHPQRTNYFLPKRRTCPPKRERMVTLIMCITKLQLPLLAVLFLFCFEHEIILHNRVFLYGEGIRISALSFLSTLLSMWQRKRDHYNSICCRSDFFIVAVTTLNVKTAFFSCGLFMNCCFHCDKLENDYCC